MYVIKRAFRSLNSRPLNSLLLLFLITAITIFILISIVFQSTATEVKNSIINKMGSTVTLATTENLAFPIEIATELESDHSVQSYNFFSYTLATPTDFDIVSKGNINVEGVLFTDTSHAFLNGEASIKEGRQITDADSSNLVTIINQTLAEANDLQLEDTITLASASNPDNTLTLSIIGIYEMAANLPTATTPLYIPYQAANQLKGSQSEGTIDRAIYYSDDSSSAQSFIQQVKETGKLDFSEYTLNFNSYLFQQLTGEMDQLDDLSKNYYYYAEGFGLLFLLIILSVSIWQRKEELHVLLALGEKRWKLLLQLTIEFVTISLIAWALSFIIISLLGEVIPMEQSQIKSLHPESFYSMNDYGSSMNVFPYSEIYALSLTYLFSILLGIIVPATMILNMNLNETFYRKEGKK